MCFKTVKVCLLWEAFEILLEVFLIWAVLCRRRSPGLRFSHNFSQLWRSTNTDPGIATMHESRSRRRRRAFGFGSGLPLFDSSPWSTEASPVHRPFYSVASPGGPPNIDSYCRIINKGGQIELINNTLCGRTSYELLLKPPVDFCIEGWDLRLIKYSCSEVTW